MKPLIRNEDAPLRRNIAAYNDAIAARHPSRRAAIAGMAATLASVMTFAPAAAAKTVRLVALGDSLVAGYGLPSKDGFVPQLQAALKARGHAVVVANAGVSGDTSTGGADRVDWAVPDGTDGVIVELGANDMLRGIDPAVTKKALARILDRLAERRIPAMLAGMRASPNLGAAYGREFDRMYADLAKERGIVLFPFFLQGVAGDRALNQGDGIHPNARGVAVIVEAITPSVERFLERIAAGRS